MGVQVATGLAVEEVGLYQEVHIQPRPNNEGDEQTRHQIEEFSENVNQDQINMVSESPPPPSSLLRAISSPPLMFVEQEIEKTPLINVFDSQPNWNEPGPSRLSHAPAPSPPQARFTPPPLEPEIEVTGLLSPTRPSTQVRVRHVAVPSVETTPRRTRRSRSPRRRARPAHTEQAAQHFLQADSQWRNFKEQQHNDIMELKREQNRIREMELQTQRGWQLLGGRIIDILGKIADKYCKD